MKSKIKRLGIVAVLLCVGSAAYAQDFTGAADDSWSKFPGGAKSREIIIPIITPEGGIRIRAKVFLEGPL